MKINLIRWYKDKGAKREKKVSDNRIKKIEIAKEKIVNIVNTDKETVNKAKVENLSEILDREGIRNGEVNIVESCQKSVDKNNIKSSSENGMVELDEDVKKDQKSQRSGLIYMKELAKTIIENEFEADKMSVTDKYKTSIYLESVKSMNNPKSSNNRDKAPNCRAENISIEDQQYIIKI
ncbi:hypothetical protein F8M41_003440 [Gigaspora margarita]|uniref:Uncharacterized protein n=1 Tax=Gigaspora margarita TaxID=4874 RepID=A0A8H4ES51_GIGMA|nr:hypothetical protein F8M41_003440 [Gigaspora margarita]